MMMMMIMVVVVVVMMMMMMTRDLNSPVHARPSVAYYHMHYYKHLPHRKYIHTQE